MNEARLIAFGKTTRPVTLVRLFGLDDSWLGFFMPLGFAPSPHGSMHPTYPAGLPMHLALAGIIGGWARAPFLIAPFAAVGCVFLVCFLSRRLGLPRSASSIAAAAMATLPPFLWHAVQPASDVLATFWALVAICCAFVASERPWAALAAGAAFGISVWVRPTNVLLLFPLVLALRLQIPLLVSAALGALPFGVSLMWWNSALYSSPIRTGYGGFLPGLSWAGVRYAAPQHAEWLARMLSPIGFPGGLLVLWDRRCDLWVKSALIAWITAFFVFYSFYGFFDGYLCIRFLLPAIPALIIGALLILRDAYAFFARHDRRLSLAIFSILALCIAVAPALSTWSLGVLQALPNMERRYPDDVHWAEQLLPRRAVVITGVLSGPFLYYSNRSIIRYDQLNDERFQTLRAYAGIHELPWYAVVADSEIQHRELKERFRGRWTLIANRNAISVYRLDS
ncbi:MAG TPA: hypothetical protein VER58_19455 [Thermoanaerobaculia bacterium]|nr:hypothetical protein [Thermoanaerobaculia bacterium]